MTTPTGRAAVVFWRAPVYQREPQPPSRISIGASAPTLRALDGDKSPLVSRADAPKNVWPAAPPHDWNRRDADHTPVHRARVLPNCAPVGQGQGKPPLAGLDRPAETPARRRAPSATPKGGITMTHQREAHAVIRREVACLGRSRTHPIHPGYAAIVAKAHALSLPQCSATDITIHDRRLITRRQPRQFAWLLHRCGSLLSLPEPNQQPLDYLHATRRLYGHALAFWWDGTELMQTANIDQLIARMQTACAELQCNAEELR
jgi:hypothetical protein